MPDQSDRGTTHGQPVHGDIVIVREQHSAPSWTLLRHPGPRQLSFQTREDALNATQSIARESAVNLWSSQDGAYRLLESYRRESD
jgi:hypothetical protein